MKKLLTMLLLVLFTVTLNATTLTSGSNDINPVKGYTQTEFVDTINTVKISVPCRLIFCTSENGSENTYVAIYDKTQSYNITYIFKDSVLYIKTNLRNEDFDSMEQEKKQTLPVIRIMSKQQPAIITGSGYTLSNSNYGKATKTRKN